MLSARVPRTFAGMMYYAGIGSRDTPASVAPLMTQLAAEMERIGWTLRSGAARGADTFFEDGVIDPYNKEIFIHRERTKPARNMPMREHNPFQGVFNAQRYVNYGKAVQIASEVHGAWHKCDQVAREMHARNVYQVLGPEMLEDSFSKLLVCWAIPDIHGVPEGGTRTAWLIAERYGIPRYNLALPEDRDRVVDWLASRAA